MKPLNEESDKKKIIVEKYNSTSSFYDNRYRKIQNEKYSLVFKEANFKYKTLLDAGCGTGLLYEYVSSLNCVNLNRNFRYIGLDISWKMLKQFHNKIKSQINTGHYSLILGDIENLPFRRDEFNLILSITSLQNLPNLKKGLKELIRVGKEKTALMLSILNKQLEVEDVITFLNSRTVNLRTDTPNKIEDVFIQGNLLKD